MFLRELYDAVDAHGTFVYVPVGSLEAMTELLRRRVIALLVNRKMKVTAAIHDPEQIHKILAYLKRTARPPPGMKSAATA